MNRATLLLLLLVGCSGGGGSRPGPGPQPSPVPKPAPVPVAEPVAALNVQPPSPEKAAVVLSHLQALRVEHIRVSWWAWSSPQDWGWLPLYRAMGIDVLPLVYPTHDGSYGRRYAALREAFGDFPAVQLDNEIDGAWPGRRLPLTYTDGFQQGHQIATGAREVKAQHPAAQIVGPGLAWNADGIRDWLRGFLDATRGAVDVVAVHVYGHHPWGPPLGIGQAVKEAGWQGEVWITEVGQPSYSTQGYYRAARGREATAPEVEDFHREAWRQVYSVDGSRLLYRRIYGFQLTADSAGYGLLNFDGSPRPAYEWLKKWRAP